MALSLRLNPEDFPDSRYAAELRRNFPNLRFSATIEQEYIRAHLVRVARRVRLWLVVGLGFTTGYTIQAAVQSGPLSQTALLNGGFELLMLAAVWFAFSTLFLRLYLTVAAVAVPLIGCGVAALGTWQFAHGRVEQLILVPAALVSTFFSAGVLFRTAVCTGSLMVLTFDVAGGLLGVPHHLIAGCTGMLAITLAIGSLVAWDVERSYRESFLEARLVSELAVLDGLTGVKNRRAFDEHFSRIWQQAQRDGRSLALLLIDCDHFKRYNDGKGHQAGDEALRRIAHIIDYFARHPLDIAARYRGEKFALALTTFRRLPHGG